MEGTSRSLNCDVKPNCLRIRASKSSTIQVSVQKCMMAKEDENSSLMLDCQFLLVNSRDVDNCTEALTQEVLSLYTKELPEMSYAANTGKKSTFLQRCVSNGKYRTLLLRSNNLQGLRKVIAAISYQIIPADTQFAEIPLAAVCSMYQHKGIGGLLYMELRKRLQSVGVNTVLCWGDKESEGFWQKQGFISVAEVDGKGKVRKLPLKADIRRALSFPGGSVLMMSHLSRDHELPANRIKLNVHPHSLKKSIPSADLHQNLIAHGVNNDSVVSKEQVSSVELHLQPEVHCEQLRTTSQNTQSSQKEQKERGQTCCLQTDSVKNAQLSVGKGIGMVMELDSAEAIAQEFPSTCEQKGKRTVWEASLSSLGSKRVKASSESETRDDSFGSTKGKPTIMLMDIADGTKKTHLTKVIEDLGGTVTPDGDLSTHVLTGKVRKTLNFCTAICSGAWVLSPNWLKASFREGRFVDVNPFILEDEDYRTKFKIDLKEAVFRARKRPRGLLKGYQVCLTTHFQPPVETLSTIVRSAGGNVALALDDIYDKSQAIFVAGEEDMEEVLLAARRGIRTFSIDWFMNCIMKQELDLDAPQFAESL